MVQNWKCFQIYMTFVQKVAIMLPPCKSILLPVISKFRDLQKKPNHFNYGICSNGACILCETLFLQQSYFNLVSPPTFQRTKAVRWFPISTSKSEYYNCSFNKERKLLKVAKEICINNLLTHNTTIKSFFPKAISLIVSLFSKMI